MLPNKRFALRKIINYSSLVLTIVMMKLIVEKATSVNRSEENILVSLGLALQQTK